MDPREAILRHQTKDDSISLMGRAYKETQPVPIFAAPDEDEEEDS